MPWLSGLNELNTYLVKNKSIKNFPKTFKNPKTDFALGDGWVQESMKTEKVFYPRIILIT